MIYIVIFYIYVPYLKFLPSITHPIPPSGEHSGYHTPHNITLPPYYMTTLPYTTPLPLLHYYHYHQYYHYYHTPLHPPLPHSPTPTTTATRLRDWVAKAAERETMRRRKRQERHDKRHARPSHRFDEDGEYTSQRSKVTEQLQQALDEGIYACIPILYFSLSLNGSVIFRQNYMCINVYVMLYNNHIHLVQLYIYSYTYLCCIYLYLYTVSLQLAIEVS